MKKLAVAGFIMITLLVLYCEQKHGAGKELADYSSYKAEPAPEWARSGILYQVFPRVFTEEGTFKALQKNLEYIQGLGVDIIWMLPAFPIGQQGKKGRWGCPFSVQNFGEVNPEYGTKDDFKKLVDDIHQRGMKIILGMVPNHGSNDNVLMETHPEWFMTDKDGKFTREVDDWSDITDFNFDEPGLRQYLLDTYIYWIEEFDIDGYRMDVAGMVPLDFWKTTTSELRKIKPDLYLLAEWEKPEIILNGFNSDYDWTLFHLLRDIRKGKKYSAEVINYISERDGKYPHNSLMMRFLENHDEQRSVKQFGKEAIEAYATLLFTLPGIPLIYAGQEAGETERPTLFDEFQISSPEKNNLFTKMYQKLIKMRKSGSCFTGGQFITVNTNDDRVGAFIRQSAADAALVVTNLSDSEVTGLQLQIPDEFQELFGDIPIRNIHKYTTKVL